MTYAYTDSPRENILRMIPADGMEIGSIGCSFGATESLLVGAGRRVHGVDVESRAIEIAKTRLTTARLVSPSERDLFAVHSLDGLILADVIEHMPFAWEALAAHAKAVRPGGWVVISVPNMRSIKVLHMLFLRGDWPELDQGIFDRTHLQVMSKKRVSRWCDYAGLVPEQWFDSYLTSGLKRTALRVLDSATLHLFHELTLHQIQVRCRKT